MRSPRLADFAILRRVKFYGYSGCSTCQKAKRWLIERGIPFEERPIRESPPTRSELAEMCEALGGRVRALFNTSGAAFRAGGWSKKLDGMSVDEALDALSRDGHLVKRPFVIAPNARLIGFNPAKWAEVLRAPSPAP